MNKKSITYVFCCCFIFLSIAGGCRRSGLDGLVPCRGTITRDSKPLQGVLITLIPHNTDSRQDESAGEQRAASCTSDAAGKFVLTTLRENDGVFPGTYKVLVTKYEMSGEVITLPEIDQETGMHLTMEKSVNRLSKKYETVQDTPLEVTIPNSGNKSLNLVLEN